QVSAEYIDAVKDPIQAKSNQVQTYGTVVLQYDGRTERVAQTDEQSLTNALKKVIEGQSKKVYFVQGHGEHDIEGTDRASYSAIVIGARGMGRLINAGPEVPIAMPSQPPHPITKDFRLMTAFPLTRSVTPIEGGTDGKVAQKFLETSPQSWGEVDLKGLFTTS